MNSSWTLSSKWRIRTIVENQSRRVEALLAGSVIVGLRAGGSVGMPLGTANTRHP